MYLNSTDLKQYIKFSRSCKITDNGIVLLPTCSKLELDLSSINAKKCSLYFKRVSGNGYVQIRHDVNVFVFNVLSRLNHNFDIELVNDGRIINIIRPPVSSGEIILYGINITEENIIENPKINVSHHIGNDVVIESLNTKQIENKKIYRLLKGKPPVNEALLKSVPQEIIKPPTLQKEKNNEQASFLGYKEEWRKNKPIYYNYDNDNGDVDLSIIISSYKRAHLLKLGLQSIVDQKLISNIEIIVVNDGVSDDTESVCNQFKNKLNIKYIFTGHRNLQQTVWRTPGYAYNIGAKIARGKYIALSCAEMFHYGNNIEDMISVLNSNDKVIVIPNGKEDDKTLLNKLNIEGHLSFEDINNARELEGMHLPYFLGMKKEEYFEIGGYDEDFVGVAAEDNDFADRLIGNGNTYRVIDGYVVHLWHERVLSDGVDLANSNPQIEARLKYNRDLYFSKKGIIKRNLNDSWGDVTNVTRYNKWFLKRIPKVVHFYWGNDKFSYLRYMSLFSFKKYNPDWKIKLHLPKIMGTTKPTWRTHEQASLNIKYDYFNRIAELGVELVKHDFSVLGFKNEAHEVHKSDFLRWHLLSTEGGLWSDNDILYTRPMHDMINNNPSNVNVDTGVCRYSDSDSCYAIGFLFSSENNPFFKKILNMSKTFFDKNGYQSIGNALFRHYNSKRDIDGLGVNCVYIDENTVYPIRDVELYINQNRSLTEYVNTIGYHWYAGAQLSSIFENELNEENINNFNNTLTTALKYIGK